MIAAPFAPLVRRKPFVRELALVADDAVLAAALAAGDAPILLADSTRTLLQLNVGAFKRETASGVAYDYPAALASPIAALVLFDEDRPTPRRYDLVVPVGQSLTLSVQDVPSITLGLSVSWLSPAPVSISDRDGSVTLRISGHDFGSGTCLA